jgi:glycosyltransferase involved in cell wall biosynthesis
VISVIIPAFNEERTIGHLLDGLVRASDFGDDIEVIVAPNGCVDATADVARSYGVTVVEVATASKTAALNAAETVASGFPRVYLDADIEVTPALVRALGAAVSQPGVLGATARPVVDVSGSTWPVRAYYAINSRLPVMRGRLFGRGVIAIAKEARNRFGEFPDIIADDMLLDAVVGAPEKSQVDAPVRVVAPATLPELLRRVSRSRAGNDQFWQWVGDHPEVRLADPVPGASATSWLRDVVLPAPRLWPAGAVYVVVALLVAVGRRRRGWSVGSGWGRS